jgi:DnaK suppressor protein
MIALNKNENSISNTYMTPAQLELFKSRLLTWRDELIGVSNSIMNNLKEVDLRKPDPVDCGSLHAEKELNLLTRSRNARLIRQIEHALWRIEQGEYGYCEVTGEEIGLKRLEIMPLTTLSIEAQEKVERAGGVY